MRTLESILKEESQNAFCDKYTTAFHLRDVLENEGYRMVVKEEISPKKVLFVLDKNSVVKASVYLTKEYDTLDKKNWWKFNYKLRNQKLN